MEQNQQKERKIKEKRRRAKKKKSTREKPGEEELKERNKIKGGERTNSLCMSLQSS